MFHKIAQFVLYTESKKNKMENLNLYIEQTVLKPTCTEQDINALIDQAKTHSFFGICVPPYWVKKAKRDLAGHSTALVTVIGFPIGYSMTEVKIKEAEIAIENGADELDMVFNLTAFKTNAEGWAKTEVARIANLAHKHEKILKVILETAYLSHSEIALASKLCANAGADFIKTSTGFAPRGASIEDIEIIKNSIPSEIGIKASGGIKTKDQAIAFIKAGADRLGTSSGVEIIG